MAVEALATKNLVHGWEKHRVVHRDIELNVAWMSRAVCIAKVAGLAKARRLVKRSHVLIVKTAVENKTTRMRIHAQICNVPSNSLPRDGSSVGIQ